MYNCIVKKFLFSGIILLWIVSAAYGWNGPCLNMGACGGAGGGGTCHLDPEMGKCVGTCAAYCPPGPDDQYCFGLVGSCTITVGNCSRIEKYTCLPGWEPVPHCRCVHTGWGGWCVRQTC